MLSVVGTPIGNLGDLTERAAAVLLAVDAVICEDSRRTGKLLSHLLARQEALWEASVESDAPPSRPALVVANDHTEVPRIAQILDHLAAGQHLALVSDAGMPTISDPGARIVEAVAEAGYPIEVIPGPCAVSAALALSGLAATPYVFEGFLPRRGLLRQQRLAAIGAEARTVVLYEAPHRLALTLQDLLDACGPDRRAVVCREMTKLHEEVRRATLADHVAYLDEAEPRGEYVVVLGPQPVERVEPTDDEIRSTLATAIAAGASKRDAARQVAGDTGLSRRRVYELANELP